MSPVERDFTLAHECYHLSSGDARQVYEHGIPDSGQDTFEDNADCDAAGRMREEFHYTAEDMRTLEPLIRRATTYRKEDARVTHVMDCYNAADERQRLVQRLP